MANEIGTPAAAPVIHEFPKMLYHHDIGPRIVASRDEQDALGAEWHETPTAPEIEPPAAPPAPPPTDPW